MTRLCLITHAPHGNLFLIRLLLLLFLLLFFPLITFHCKCSNLGSNCSRPATFQPRGPSSFSSLLCFIFLFFLPSLKFFLLFFPFYPLSTQWELWFQTARERQASSKPLARLPALPFVMANMATANSLLFLRASKWEVERERQEQTIWWAICHDIFQPERMPKSLSSDQMRQLW